MNRSLREAAQALAEEMDSDATTYRFQAAKGDPPPVRALIDQLNDFAYRLRESLAAPPEPGWEEGAESLARRFHAAYEELAPSFGYATRPESAKPWAEVPENNRRLMVAVAARILAPPVPAAPTHAAPEAQITRSCGCVTCVCGEVERCRGCGGSEAAACQASRLSGGPRHVPPAPEAKTAESEGVRGPAMLPEGKCCADCFHIERCQMLGCTQRDNIMCDWSPSRFAPAPVEPEETPPAPSPKGTTTESEDTRG